jgi:hypothetical protein
VERDVDGSLVSKYTFLAPSSPPQLPHLPETTSMTNMAGSPSLEGQVCQQKRGMLATQAQQVPGMPIPAMHSPPVQQLRPGTPSPQLLLGMPGTPTQQLIPCMPRTSSQQQLFLGMPGTPTQQLIPCMPRTSSQQQLFLGTPGTPTQGQLPGLPGNSSQQLTVSISGTPSEQMAGILASPPPRQGILGSPWSPAYQNPYGTVPRSFHTVDGKSSLFASNYVRSLPRFQPKLRPAKSETSLKKYSSSPKLGRSWHLF